jgi:hypothetical protein
LVFYVLLLVFRYFNKLMNMLKSIFVDIVVLHVGFGWEWIYVIIMNFNEWILYDWCWIIVAIMFVKVQISWMMIKETFGLMEFKLCFWILLNNNWIPPRTEPNRTILRFAVRMTFRLKPNQTAPRTPLSTVTESLLIFYH